MANGRRPIPPLRAYTAAVLAVFALFVVSAGAGMASWSIVVLGVALMILAGSLVVVSAMRGGTRAYVAGTAHVVSASEPPASSMYGRCELQLVVEAPGMAAAAVKVRDSRVPVAKWPDAGTALPIMVAVDDPRRVRVQWDDVPTHAERVADERLAGEYAEEYTGPPADEYPEYVPRRDPMDVPPEMPPAAGASGEPGDDDLHGLDDLLGGPVSPAGPAADEAVGPAADEAVGPAADEAVGPAGPAGSAAGEPVGPARSAGSAADEPADEPAAARAEKPAPRPPAPRRPEAAPETPDDEVYDSPRPPRPRPRPRPSRPNDRASGGEGTGIREGTGTAPRSGSGERANAAPHAGSGEGPGTAARAGTGNRYGAMTAAHATGAASTGAATTVVDLELSLAPDHREETEPPAPAEQTTGQSGEASPGPSVTAIEFDLGELVTAYPSARPGAAGPISGVGITVHVTDLARSAEFYRDLLGFYEIDGGDGSLVLASGNTRVVLREVHDAAGVDGRLVHINLEVADVQAMYEELVAKRVRFTYDPRPTSRGERLELWAAEFHDPDGHRIAITQWRARGDAQP